MLLKVRYMLVTLMFSLLAVGCGGGGSSTGTTGPTASELAAAIYSIKTAGAEGYMVTGSTGTATGLALATGVTGTSTAVTLEPNSLYMVTAEGTLERVPVQDEAGAELPRGSVRPFDVQDINDSFMLMWFHIPGIDQSQYGSGTLDLRPYLVRKSDGLAYDLSNLINAYGAGVDGSFEAPTGVKDIPIRADGNDNLFLRNYLGDYWGVVRIDTSTLGQASLTAQSIEEVDSIERYAVAANGRHVIYAGTSRADYTQSVLRLVDLGTGALHELASLVAGAQSTWVYSAWLYTALDGNTYVQVESGSGSVFRITQDSSGKPVATDLGVLTEEGGTVPVFGENIFNCLSNDNRERLVLNGREILVSSNGCTAEPHLDRIVNGTPTPTVRYHRAVANELSSVRDARVSGKYVWYFGADIVTGIDAIVRYDPLAETTQKFAAFTDPMTGSTLDIIKFRVMSSDLVFFEAMRLSDQATVIGTIDSQGIVTITDVVAADEPTVYVLERITPANFVAVDGMVKDWALGLRVASDASGDVAAGDDLTFYSQIAGNGEYLGLAEFNGAIEGTHRTRIRINDAYEVRIDSGAASIVPIDANGYVTGASQFLAAIGGESAVSEAVEFRLPASALGNPASYTVDIARVGDADVESLTETSASGVFTLTVGMATPLGNGTVKLGLAGGSYTLSVTSTTAILDDGTTTQDLTAVGGSITTRDATTTAITVTLPATAVGGVGVLNPTEIETTLDAISVI